MHREPLLVPLAKPTGATSNSAEVRHLLYWVETEVAAPPRRTYRIKFGREI